MRERRGGGPVGNLAIEIAAVCMNGNAELPQVRNAGRTPAGLLCPSQGRKEQRGEDCDDRNHHEQFDQREPRRAAPRSPRAAALIAPLEQCRIDAQRWN